MKMRIFIYKCKHKHIKALACILFKVSMDGIMDYYNTKKNADQIRLLLSEK